MTLTIPFNNSFATLPERFYSRVSPTPVRDPHLLAYNNGLAAELGITRDDTSDMAQVFSGNRIVDGADPLAQVYAGHQFGGYNPQLGDGRAILLGEVINHQGQRRDIQLKGAGRTPYSRNGDGRAWLGPVLREYLLSEAMHALGVPTTRALAAVSTGEKVQREKALPGAVLTRVADSHLRVGTFQYFYAKQDYDGLQQLFEYARDRHYPVCETPQSFLASVIDRQIDLVVKWLSLGFIHGVMNTDNCSISGETIDYGPAAYIDSFHPQTVYSSIDRGGRYAYGNQPNILAWNMAQLASALVPLVPDADKAIEGFTKLVNDMPGKINLRWRQEFGKKIGLEQATEADVPLIQDLLSLMAKNQADFTNTFRALSDGKARDQFLNPGDFDDWKKRWDKRVSQEDAPEVLMQCHNPTLIPRNHRVEQMIEAASEGDLSLFHQLNDALARPYEPIEDDPSLANPPLQHEVVQQTFCGT